MYTSSLQLSSFVYLLLCSSIQLCSCILFSNGSKSSNNSMGVNSQSHSAASQLSSEMLSAHKLNPRPGANTTGFLAADQCWSQWDAWTSSSSRCPKTTSTGPLTTLERTWQSVRYATFKLCDGIPRALAAGGERRTTITEPDGTFTDTEPPSGIPLATRTTTFSSVEPVLSSGCITLMPSPTCTINSKDCSTLFSVWSASNFSRIVPPCHYIESNIAACDQCSLFIPSVKLLYFPVTMTGDFCGGDYSTFTPSTIMRSSGPVTVEISGTTFTSGYAYLSYAGIDPGLCGTPKPAGVLAVPSSDLFTYRGRDPGLPQKNVTKYPLNFADLAPNPVPWDAWIGQPTCAANTWSPSCQTITQAAYRPYLVDPRLFYSMEPEWSKCTDNVFGIMDPPSALSIADQIALPTTPTAALGTTSPAAPKMDPGSSLPKATTAPEDPKTTETNDIKPSLTANPGAEIPSAPLSTARGHQSEVANPGELPPSSGPSTQDQPEHGTGISEPSFSAVVPIDSLGQSPTFVGSLPIAGADRPNAISIGTTVMSVGQTTKIGSIFASLGVSSLVVGDEPADSSRTLNALSVLQSAQPSALDPSAIATPNGQAGHGQSDGLEGSSRAALTLSSGSKATGHGQTMLHGGGDTIQNSFTNAFGSHGVEIQATFGNGVSQTVIQGHLDSAGRTIMNIGTSSFTFSGQDVSYDGTTFNVVLPSIYKSIVSGHTKGAIPTTTANTGSHSTEVLITASSSQSRSNASSKIVPFYFLLMNAETVLILLLQILSL